MCGGGSIPIEGSLVKKNAFYIGMKLITMFAIYEAIYYVCELLYNDRRDLFRYDYVICVQIPFRNLYIDSAFMKSVFRFYEISYFRWRDS